MTTAANTTAHADCTCDTDEVHCRSEAHVEENLLLVADTARACAQGWAEQTLESMKRRWTAPIPGADQRYLEGALGRLPTAAEDAEFDRVFRDEFNACMAQKAELNGWADEAQS